MRPRFVVSVLALAVVAGAALVLDRESGGGDEPTSSSTSLTDDGQTRSFSEYGLSFRYPHAWGRRTTRSSSSFSSTLVYLSNQTLGQPCSVDEDPPGSATRSITCGHPLKELLPGGVLVTWTSNGSPVWRGLEDARGTPTTVDGLPAKLLKVEHGCPGLGGDVHVVLTVDRPRAPHNFFQMDACIAEPDADATETLVRSLIASTRFEDI